jgi:hypothetical protein
MSQIGLKYFDLSLKMDNIHKGFHINYIMKTLDREFITDAIKTDFGLLLKQNKNHHLEQYIHPDNGMKEMVIRDGKQAISYIYKESHIYSIKLFRGNSVVTSIQIPEYRAGYPGIIKIHHSKARLEMSLTEF